MDYTQKVMFTKLERRKMYITQFNATQKVFELREIRRQTCFGEGGMTN